MKLKWVGKGRTTTNEFTPVSKDFRSKNVLKHSNFSLFAFRKTQFEHPPPSPSNRSRLLIPLHTALGAGRRSAPTHTSLASRHQYLQIHFHSLAMGQGH